MKPATHVTEYSGEAVLFVAFELSNKKWKLGMSVSKGVKTRNRTVDAGDFAAVEEAMGRAKRRFGLAESALVVSVYEAGRDGFWIHRRLEEMGVRNLVIDPASVDVNRRKKRAKTDPLDIGKLMKNLIQWWEGDRNVWSVVVVPSEKDEDARHFHRELEALKGERTRHTNRIKSLLVMHGVRMAIGGDFAEKIGEIRTAQGSKLPPQLRRRLEREAERLALVREQIRGLEEERRNGLATVEDVRFDKMRKLLQLRALGPNGAWLLVMEFFGWREFRNRKQVGSLAGLTPTPFASGDVDNEQGIDKAGVTRVRTMMIELAWRWVQIQPKSEITEWFNREFGGGSRRHRRVGIVAVARKLLVQLWRYVEHDVLPPGAQLKPCGL